MNRNFLPWIGNKYYNKENFFGCKVLVIGESIYCGYSEDYVNKGCKEKGCLFERGLYDKDCAEFLTHLDESYDLDTSSSAFYKFAIRMAPDMNPYDFFEHITFAEWLQVGVENSYDKRRDLYPQMDEPFFQTLDELQPDILLLWGTEINSEAGPGAYTPGSYESNKSYPNTAGAYKTKSGLLIPAYFMTHPSARKSNDFFTTETIKIKEWIKSTIIQQK